jgi:L-ornithine N5-monooxygenase
MLKIKKETHVVDVLGIGFGPSNIALAIALEESVSTLNVHFIEAAKSANWQAQMLLNGSDIQNNPLRDLVTPRNPRSQYTFVNYLKCQGRLFDFLNLDILYPLRKDFADYVRWVASFFDNQVDYNVRARKVSYCSLNNRWQVETSAGLYEASALVIGTGRSRNIPEVFMPSLGSRVFHLCDYLAQINNLKSELSSIAVLGASQSAAEINCDLMSRFPELQIHAIHRSYSMRQKDTSPFSDHVYFPEFIDYFFGISESAQEDLQRQLRATNYSSVDMEALHKLYMSIYEDKIDGKNRFHLHNNTVVEAVQANRYGVCLTLRERFLDQIQNLNVDAVVLATGFLDLGQGEGKELFPPLLAEVADGLARRTDGALLVERDYRVASENGLAIYLNGLCESSHGLGDAGSFSLLALRSIEILESLNKYFEYLLEPIPNEKLDQNFVNLVI